MRYLTKEWYLAAQARSVTPDIQKRLDDASAAYRAAQAREALPDGLRERFFFHDGVVLECRAGADYTLRIDCPFSPYHTVVFRSASVRGEQPPPGALWLYEELYRHKSGCGYEAHILFWHMEKPVHRNLRDTDLLDLKIICSDILFE